MKRRLFKTMVAVLAIAAAAAGPAWGQTTYNVTFSGFSMGYINTTVNVTSLPQTFTSVDDYDLKPWNVFSDACFEFTGAPVTSGGEGKVSANFVEGGIMSITVSGTFEGTATIHVTGNDDHENPISTDVYVSCVAPAVPHTVRMAAGTEDAGNWTLASGNESVPGTGVLENVMSGSQVTATYNGTRKVKSVKAVKYVPPTTPLDNTMTAWADGRYAVPAGGLTYSAAITVSGNVTLVLTDGETLTLNKGISLASGATLTIEGTGTMNVKGSNGNTSSTTGGSGTITLTSGTLTATGGNGQNGWDLGTGAAGGAAINGSVIVDGGTLTATGGNGGNVGNDLWNGHGGAGGAAISGSLTINAGTVTTTNGAAGSVGYECDDCSAGTGGKAVAGTVTDNR